ncbi:MAG: L,D-transpeptidase family protein [Candidatus Methylumidiphilus sp.]
MDDVLIGPSSLEDEAFEAKKIAAVPIREVPLEPSLPILTVSLPPPPEPPSPEPLSAVQPQAETLLATSEVPRSVATPLPPPTKPILPTPAAPIPPFGLPRDGSAPRIILPSPAIPPQSGPASLPANIQPLEAVRGNLRVLISIADRRLYLLQQGRPLLVAPVAIPKSNRLIHIGDTTIVARRVKPTWYPTAKIRRIRRNLPAAVPPGAANPLGDFALNLAWTNIRIHGTNQPQSIGTAATAGCFRMRNEDVRSLFDLVEVGTPVRVIQHSFQVDD